MLATFLDCQNEVLNFGFNDGPQVNRGRVKNWINEAQKQIAREEEGPEFQKTITIGTNAGTYAYGLPSDFLRMQAVAFSQMGISLSPVDLKDFVTMDPSQVSGPPANYTFDGSNLLVFPNPDAVYALDLYYLANPPVLVNDTDVPVLNSDYLHLLVMYAVARAFEGEDDYEAAQYFAARYKSDLANYASDVQWRAVDRPRQVDGTWSSGSVSRSAW